VDNDGGLRGLGGLVRNREDLLIGSFCGEMVWSFLDAFYRTSYAAIVTLREGIQFAVAGGFFFLL
jgi:hypothetical protein